MNAVNPLHFINNKTLIQRAKNNQAAAPIQPSSLIKVDNIYYNQGIPGALPEIFARQVVKEILEEAVKKLPPDYGVVVYDVFRTLVAQKALFLQFKATIAENNPSWDEEKLMSETKKLVPLPGDPSGPSVMPHNTGGAVDLTLTYKGNLCEMGTPFDDSSSRARPEFFEAEYDAAVGIPLAKWEAARQNRRMLFNIMTSVGFVVHPFEWWHFNFGNQPWSIITKIPPFYCSMEEEYAIYQKTVK